MSVVSIFWGVKQYGVLYSELLIRYKNRLPGTSEISSHPWVKGSYAYSIPHSSRAGAKYGLACVRARPQSWQISLREEFFPFNNMILLVKFIEMYWREDSLLREDFYSWIHVRGSCQYVAQVHAKIPMIQKESSIELFYENLLKNLFVIRRWEAIFLFYEKILLVNLFTRRNFNRARRGHICIRDASPHL